MSPPLEIEDLIPSRFPRVSGDEPVSMAFTWKPLPFSPRERG